VGDGYCCATASGIEATRAEMAIIETPRQSRSAAAIGRAKILGISKPQPGVPGNAARLSPTETAYAEEPGPEDREDGLGKRLFEANCTGCHLWNGEGRQTSYAALEGSRAVSDPKGTNLVQALLVGLTFGLLIPPLSCRRLGRDSRISRSLRCRTI
jgi:mono/diheme cytochrome c family protein